MAVFKGSCYKRDQESGGKNDHVSSIMGHECEDGQHDCA